MAGVARACGRVRPPVLLHDRRRSAIHIAAAPAVVADIAKRVDAPWMLEVREWRSNGEVEPKEESQSERMDRVVSNWTKDTEILEEEMFGEWLEARPDGTREQFDFEWVWSRWSSGFEDRHAVRVPGAEQLPRRVQSLPRMAIPRSVP